MASRADSGAACAYDAWYETSLGAASHRIELALVAELAAPAAGGIVVESWRGTASAESINRRA